MGAGFGRLGGLSDKKMKQVFHQHDVDNSETVSTDELLAMMVEMKLGAKNPADNAAFLKKYLEESGADQNNDGQLDFEEFKVFCKAAKEDRKAHEKKHSRFHGFFGGLSEQKMLGVFLDHDKDNSGTVSEDELLAMMEDLNLGSDDPDANVQFLTEYFQAHDDGNGQLDFAEFKAFCGEAQEQDKSEKAARKKGAKVAPTKGPAGQSKGYSSEAEKFKAEKKAQQAKDKADLAARLAKQNRESKARIAAAKKKGGGMKAAQGNKEYAKQKKEKAKQRKYEAARSKADGKAHAAEVKAKAKALKQNAQHRSDRE